ncbi:hypothetical protein CW745_10555 [Psychromonas sp. psych-6C06]|uniref:tellurite resistance TerB family protein n=1 Tax=Psychromonas sp. psych-6C06 TaxID=2058089 RepID=UPI000C341505|nr:TerB family tellurite resistance protein [Psychromonas sp. psych-6C06]PKF61747.1 hypothetical protein CW745_10555 [Psychromonas sp. psych-6C06]
MIKKVTNYLSSLLNVDEDEQKSDHRVAIASLLCAVAYADHNSSEIELDAIKHCLIKLLKITKDEVETMMQLAQQDMLESNSIFDFTSLLSDLEHDERINVIEMMWQVAYADAYLDEIEEAIIRRVAGLLYVPHSEFIRTKLKVLASLEKSSGN